MNAQISFALFLAASVISSQDDDGDSKDARKHYGLSYHSKCVDYVKSFTCMTTCKSIGFQIFRMDFRCKCSCHALKTTTILPFFKWRTNGTTKTLPSTQSPQLYHIAGTLSPARSITTDEIIETTTNACGYGPTTDNSTATTSSDDDGNATTIDNGSEYGNATTGDDGSTSGTTIDDRSASGTTIDDGSASGTTIDDGSASDNPITVEDRSASDDATTVDDGSSTHNASVVDDGSPSGNASNSDDVETSAPDP